MAARCQPPARLQDDPYLDPFRENLSRRAARAEDVATRIAGGTAQLADFASGHEYYGLHRRDEGWVFTEWAPHAHDLVLIGSFCDWGEHDAFRLQRINEKGDWQLRLPADALGAGDLYRLRVRWPGGAGERIPSHARRVVQDPHTNIFNAEVWAPASPYVWQHASPGHPAPVPLIYEAHVGMATEAESVGSYTTFREEILPRIVDAGYNTIQLMAVMEHPYYGSFGYHVSSFYAASSRFGTPDELKALIDAAHGAGLNVIMDLVHSHAVKNEVEGLSRFDGSPYQYFHDGPRGDHRVWDSRCFDYAKPEVLHFLLSNCRYWLDEYHVDGFRFDGVTSMLYHHHGLGTAFTTYDQYFGDEVDEDAYTYLCLANRLIHALRPDAITVAEDVSGMPGLAAPIADGGCGFGYTLAMGVPDTIFKTVRELRDEDWNLSHLWHELGNRRPDACTISYVESHDQAIVGSKTLIFELIDADMYTGMRKDDANLRVERGMALHKMLRLATLACSGQGYLNFMGNEFGHPEWIDFPREGNGWSYHFARRRWSLRDDPALRYHCLADFDRAMLAAVADSDCLTHAWGNITHVHEEEKLLAYARGALLFLFNFHADRSYANHALHVPEGSYRHVLDTDDPAFDGQGRIAGETTYATTARPDGTPELRVYLPARTALVLARTARPEDTTIPGNYVG